MKEINKDIDVAEQNIGHLQDDTHVHDGAPHIGLTMWAGVMCVTALLTRALKCKTLGGMVSHSTAATHISVVCIYCACACECLAAPSRPSPVSRLFHAGCTSS